MVETRLRILIAEDDPAILDLVRTRLELSGYATLAARDGYRALEGIRTNRPAAVILDIGLPGMTGYDVLTALRRTERSRLLPVLMLTARHGAEDVKKAIALGARDFVAKPFDDQQLLARVARLVRKPRDLPETEFV